ncbi:CHASE2 domain-containing protein [Geminicoccus roseus]|uniref:CHASE2 domain-containing protein n=1 Tax=Geminicoccus roseus TaxID=404900 RepID=UPI00040515CB|nr:CHASE2 domain-containing protein [Geminicoccus roseus]
MPAAPASRERRLEIGPFVILLLIALLSLGATILLRQVGVLRPVELAGYDLIVTLARQLPDRPDPGVVVLGIDSRDKVAFDWPLPDQVVMEVVEKLARLEPAAIGLDFFRGDRPVGPLGAVADPAETDRLVARLEATPNVVLILDTFRFELPERLTRLASPEIDRVASPTLVPDEDDVLRRGILGDVFPDPEVAEPVLGLWSLAAALVRVATAGEELVPEGPVADDVMPLGRRAVPPLAVGAGPYAGSDMAGGGYEFLASWPVAELPMLRLADLLDDRVDPDLVRGRIVLVGATARSVGDMVTSPILGRASKSALPGRTVFGVEAHAQLAAQLLMEARGQVPALAPAPAASWVAALALASFSGAAVGGLIARPLVSLPVLMLGCLVWPAAALAAFSAGWWIAWVPSLSGWILSAVLAFVLVASRERRQRARMAGLFRTYLPPSVADTLWASRDRLMRDGRPAPQSMVASVLFSDIRGFTTVSEAMSPAELLDWLEAFHALMVDCIAEQGGIVADFMGDGMMAAFGVPIPRTDPAGEAADARAAVAAALAVRRRLPLLSAELIRSGRPGIAIRIGIHTGPLVAGAIGGKARLQYTILGDTVNTAARLESWSGPTFPGDEDHCRILISESTLRHLDGHVPATPVGTLPLKGKTRPVSVFRILGPSPGPLEV